VVGLLLILAYKAGKVDAGFRKLSRGIPRLAAALTGSHPIPPAKKTNRQQESPAAGDSAYSKSQMAPNGLPWPKEAEYLPGSKVLRNKGFSVATIDNTRNGSDVLAKLVAVGQGFDGSPGTTESKDIPTWQFPQDMRVFFIPAHQSFTLRNIDPGTYQVHYQDLGQGMEWKSDSFIISETPSPSGLVAGQGVRFSRINILLYRGPTDSCNSPPLGDRPGVTETGNRPESTMQPKGPLWYLSDKTVHDRFDAD
jgi:hypothetical protein